MPRAAGQPFTKGDVFAFATMVLSLVLVAVALAAMTGRTGRAQCDAASNPSTSAPVGASCTPNGYAAR